MLDHVKKHQEELRKSLTGSYDLEKSGTKKKKEEPITDEDGNIVEKGTVDVEDGKVNEGNNKPQSDAFAKAGTGGGIESTGQVDSQNNTTANFDPYKKTNPLIGEISINPVNKMLVNDKSGTALDKKVSNIKDLTKSENTVAYNGYEEIQKSRISNMFYNLPEDELEKSKGEGSKGGKIIGHTKSGKAIYKTKVLGKVDSRGSSGAHPDWEKAHKGFKREDHEDAAKVHDKLAKEARKKMNETTGKESQKASDDWIDHENLRDAHKHEVIYGKGGSAYDKKKPVKVNGKDLSELSPAERAGYFLEQEKKKVEKSEDATDGNDQQDSVDQRKKENETELKNIDLVQKAFDDLDIDTIIG